MIFGRFLIFALVALAWSIQARQAHACDSNMKYKEVDCELPEAGDSQECADFKALMQKAIDDYKADCQKAIQTAGQNGKKSCPNGQTCSNDGAGTTSGDAAGQVQALIKKLNDHHKKITDLRDKFGKGLDQKEHQACSNPNSCDRAFNPRKWGDGNDEDPSRSMPGKNSRLKRGMEVQQFRQRMRSQLEKAKKTRQPKSDITGTDADKSAFLARAAEIANSMNAFQAEVDRDIQKLQPTQRQLQQQARTNQDRSNKMGSDVTGGQGGGQQAGGQGQGSGGGQQGGGSGGGSGGGGSPSSPDSGISDAGVDPGGTSPTPENENPGSSTADGKNKGSDSSTADGKGGNGLVDIAPGNGTGGTNFVSGPFGSGGGHSGSSFGEEGNSRTNRLRSSKGGGVARTGSIGGGGGSFADSSGSSSPGEDGRGGEDVAGAAGGHGGIGGGGGGDEGGSGGETSDEVLSPFGKPLSDPKFSLAGSETDASVKDLMEDFDGEEAQGGFQGNRDLASGDVYDGIGERNGPSLFERTRAYYERCARNACVTRIKKKTSGG